MDTEKFINNHNFEKTSEIRVTYGEVDRMNFAYYGNYLRWFEIGRSEFIRLRGKSYQQLETEGVILPVIETYIQYRQAAKYDDLLEIWTLLMNIDRARIQFGYRIVRKVDSKLLTEGHTIHACIDPKGRPRRLPENFIQYILK